MLANKTGVLVGSVVLCVVFWLVGGFVFGASFAGMACVILGITVAGLGAGNFMNSPCQNTSAQQVTH